MRTRGARSGVTLTEMMVAMALLAVIAVAFSAFLKYVLKTAVSQTSAAEGQEAARQGLQKIELALVHANEVTIASGTLVEFVADIDQSPLWDRNGDADGDGVPNWKDADTDADAQEIQPSSAAWRSGFNLTDDDEDGDGQIDVKRRLYLQNSALWLDAGVNGEPWGGRATKVLADVSTFTLSYWGNKGNLLGKNIDTSGDGIISSGEMDCAPAGGGNCNGVLDLAVERQFITTIRLSVGIDANHDGKTDYKVETDVYPPLLPLKPLQK